jgi:nitrogen-specific signal transduction histidine kinase
MAFLPETLFAPPERAESEALAKDVQLLMQSAMLDHLTRTIPCILMILNRQRQIVYANKCVLDMLGAAGLGEIIGSRPGEMVGCINAGKAPSGCGTGESCSECGAVLAILRSQAENKTSVSECTISTVSGESYEFKVWASPYTFENRDFTVVSLLNIHDEKRRQTLERVFFHDVSNILMALVSSSELLAVPGDQVTSKDYIEGILAASRQLAEEIASQRRLLQAENGELAVNISAVNSRSVLEETRRTFSIGDSWKGRAVLVDQDCDSTELETDRDLLRRVINNMVTNALEATAEGEQVRLSCAKSGSSAVFSVHNAGDMSRTARLKIFQRSFSTKGRGRGLGTYSMKLFGEKYLKGRVWFSASEDEGTTFYLSIPLKYNGNES